jgi:glycosyltransferase involved in cell wall biosynthesis
MKVAIYNPSLEALGGGEKYLCTIAEALSAEHEVHILSHSPHIKREQLEERLDVDLSKVDFVYLPRLENISSKYKIFGVPRILKYYNDRKNHGSEFQNNYDLLVNVTITEPFFCHSKIGILHVQFPFEKHPREIRRKLRKLPQYLYYSFEWWKRIRSYRCIVVNSNFTRFWLQKRWKADGIVLYPPIDANKFRTDMGKKKMILSVGRFFLGGHNKKQHIMIKAFKELCEDGFKDWELHLIGGVTNSEKDQIYLQQLYEEGKGYPIFIHVNIPFTDTQKYYEESSIYWHATGYGENEEEHPEKLEHFGITTVEAMSAGCVPIVIKRGGQPEIVRHNLDGYLWNNLEELKSYTVSVSNNPELLRGMSKSSTERSRHFDKKEFERKFLEIVKKASE